MQGTSQEASEPFLMWIDALLSGRQSCLPCPRTGEQLGVHSSGHEQFRLFGVAATPWVAWLLAAVASAAASQVSVSW